MVFHSATDPAELRRCLGQFATGVTIVACRAGNARHGATVNAFSAVSLDPPLVLVALDRRSKVCAYLEGQPFSGRRRSAALPLRAAPLVRRLPR
jgi:flavin reductase (DIM6/NTAB) family NADH-FMN oxidoreductase RutF